MRAWFFYLLLFLNLLFAVLNPTLALAAGTFDGWTVVLLVANIVGAGLVVTVLSRTGWPHWSDQI